MQLLELRRSAGRGLSSDLDRGIVAETPTMVSVCAPTWNEANRAAQQRCSANGKSATVIVQPEAWRTGAWTFQGALGNFHCE